MFDNLGDVYILGKATILNDEISAMDNIVQHMSSQTEEMKQVLMECSDATFGEQFERAVTEAEQLSDVLYEKAFELNKVQHDLVRYIDKIDVFNDRPPSGIPPRPFNVERIHVEANIRYDKLENVIVEDLIRGINEYSRSIADLTRQMVYQRDSIGEKWKDSQFDQYSRFIDEIVEANRKGISVLIDYANYLLAKLRQFEE